MRRSDSHGTKNTNDSAELPSPIIDITASVNDEDVLEAREQIPTLGPGDSASEQFDTQVGYSEIGSSIFNAIEASEFQIVVEGEVESDGTSVDFSDEHTY